MKKIVVINTKTGEVQSVENYIKNSSDIWIAGWINAELLEPKPTMKTGGGTYLQDIFLKRLDTLEEVRNNQAQINNTFNEAWETTNQRIDKIITGFDNKIYKVADMLEDLNRRVDDLNGVLNSADLEGSKQYMLKEFDYLVQLINKQRTELSNHLELESLSDAKKLRDIITLTANRPVGRPKGSTKKINPNLKGNK